MNQDVVEHTLHQILGERTIVATYRLNTFRIHIVPSVTFCPQHTCVAFLVHQQVRLVHLLKLETDGLNKQLTRHQLRRLFPKLHGQLHRFPVIAVAAVAKLDHHRIGIAIHHLRVTLKAILSTVVLLNKLFRVMNHITSKRSHRRRYIETRQCAYRGAGKAIHRVGRNLERQLTTIIHRVQHAIAFACFRQLFHGAFHLLSLRQQMLQNLGQHTSLHLRFDKKLIVWCLGILRWLQQRQFRLILNQCGVAQVVRNHNRWV
mmetsp:Transcript_2133/g.4129  ORF Transcript_2133/g.4129 Transcript_2133/m.4129 type:complete len:260 (-) Transcript_2133:544-1323(-)